MTWILVLAIAMHEGPGGAEGCEVIRCRQVRTAVVNWRIWPALY